MFCSECGKEADGKFCWNCGSTLRPAEPFASPEASALPFEPPSAWQKEPRYDILLKVPEVRQRLAKAAAQCKKRLSGEEFLQLCEKVFSPVEGISLAKVAPLIAKINTRLGIRIGKHRAELIPAPVGEIIVAVLCSLARNGQSLRNVRQGQDGCVIEAAIPSDLWSFEGDLAIAIAARPEGTWVDAGTTIGGQLFDWGKSTRCLQQLFADVTPVRLARSA